MSADEMPWLDPRWIARSQVLLDSYQYWFDSELLPRSEDAVQEALDLFAAPFVVVAHGTEADPLLDYVNQTALDVWRANLAQLIGLPSRRTAEPVHRDERTRMLEESARRGCIRNYEGIRIALSGERFRISNALVWNLCNGDGQSVGQAATFSEWEWL